MIARVTGHPYFQGPPVVRVLRETLSDLQGEIENDLQKIGIVAVVREPALNPGKHWSLVEATIETQIIENPELNIDGSGTGKAAKEVAYALLRLWTYNDEVPMTQPWQPEYGWSHLTFTGLAPINLGDPLIYSLKMKSFRKL